MIRFIACDMDGTLLESSSRLPEETIGLIEELYDLGVRFCVSSGRRVGTLQELFAPVADKIDYVASNGTSIYVGDELVDKEFFSRDDLMQLADVVNQFDCLHLTCATEETSYCLDDDPDKYARFLEVHGGWTTYTPGTPPPGSELILGVCVCSDPEQIVDLAYVLNMEMGDRFVFQRTGMVAIDFTPKTVNKATGLRKVLRHHGIRRDEAVAYGDAMNDYDMLRYVGHPVVVGNALYGAYQIAERVIETNLEHGVQRDMRRIIDDLRAGGDGLVDFTLPPTAIGTGSGSVASSGGTA